MSSPNSFNVVGLGTDGSGKTSVGDKIGEHYPIVAKTTTNPVVYQWLRKANIGRSDEDFVSDQQVIDREAIYAAMNEWELEMRQWITGKRLTSQTDSDVSMPFFSVRGIADTIGTHRSLRGEPDDLDFDEAWPISHRPDGLVVFEAPIAEIRVRLAAKGEQERGANTPEFHADMQTRYQRIGEMAAGHGIPTLFINTSANGYTQEEGAGLIAQELFRLPA